MHAVVRDPNGNLFVIPAHHHSRWAGLVQAHDKALDGRSLFAIEPFDAPGWAEKLPSVLHLRFTDYKVMT